MLTRKSSVTARWPRSFTVRRRRFLIGDDCRKGITHLRGRDDSRRSHADAWRRWRTPSPATYIPGGLRQPVEPGCAEIERTSTPAWKRLVPWLAGVVFVVGVTMLADQLVRNGGLEAYGYSATVLRAVAGFFP